MTAFVQPGCWKQRVAPFPINAPRLFVCIPSRFPRSFILDFPVPGFHKLMDSEKKSLMRVTASRAAEAPHQGKPTIGLLKKESLHSYACRVDGRYMKHNDTVCRATKPAIADGRSCSMRHSESHATKTLPAHKTHVCGFSQLRKRV